MHVNIKIEPFVEKYIIAIQSRLRSHAQRRRNLERIARYFPGREVQTIRRNDFASYTEHRLSQNVTPATINIELAAYSAAINYVKRRWEIDLNNPISGLFYPSKPGRLRYLEKHEAARLLEKAKTLRAIYVSDLIEILLNTGARKNEILRLQFKSVDLQRSILTIEGETTKTGKRRYLPINKAAKQVLERRLAFREQHCPESPWVFARRDGKRIKYPEKAFRAAVDLAGIEDFHVHDLRHTFASWLVSEGVELIKVRDLLGHNSIRMTERYAHLAPNRLHDAVAVLDGLYTQQELVLEV